MGGAYSTAVLNRRAAFSSTYSTYDISLSWFYDDFSLVSVITCSSQSDKKETVFSTNQGFPNIDMSPWSVTFPAHFFLNLFQFYDNQISATYSVNSLLKF